MKKVICLLLLISFLIPNISLAHPGRTDSNGGHTCRTNCEKWGLENLEYHFHKKKKTIATAKKESRKKSRSKARTKARR